MTKLQPRGVALFCALGLFISGYVFYSSSLIEPFYAYEFKLNNWQIGYAQSSVLLGAIVGAVIAGRFADLFGRHRLLVLNFQMLIFISLCSVLTVGFYSLCTTRLLSGVLAGTLYPLCAAYLTEMTPYVSLARQSAFLMFINCLAAPLACVIAIILAFFCEDAVLWRVVAAWQALPACCAFVWSKHFPESEKWLCCQKSRKQKIDSISFKRIVSGIKIFFHPIYRNATVSLIGAWFLMDVAYYGVNFFIPYLLQLIQFQSFSLNLNDLSHSLFDLSNIVSTFLINMFFMLGAFAAILIIEKIDLYRLQRYGFFIAASSLFLLSVYFYFGINHPYLIILLFICFNFALNAGPGVTTYLLSATSYPVKIRASGHGFISGFAKFGSFLGVLFLPKFQELYGLNSVIMLLSILLMTAYFFTVNLAKTVQDNEERKLLELDAP